MDTEKMTDRVVALLSGASKKEAIKFILRWMEPEDLEYLYDHLNDGRVEIAID